MFGNSSLFGGTGAQNGPSSSPFGALQSQNPSPFTLGSTQPQTQQSVSPFGNLGSATSQPQQSSSLFGGFGQSTLQPQQSSPFGNLGQNTSQPQRGTSLFGGLGGGQSQSQQEQKLGASLFGGLGGTSQQQSAGSPFGNLGDSSQPQQTGSLFGNLETNQHEQKLGGGLPGVAFGASTQAQGKPSSSLFGNTINQIPQQSMNGAKQERPHQSDGQLTMRQPAYFDHLLERGRKRQNRENGVVQLGDLPSLQLGLGDIARKVRNLGTGSPSTAHTKVSDTKAHYLLAASGVSIEPALRDLDSFNVDNNTGATPVQQTTWETEIDGYFSNLNTQSTLALIEESMDQSKRDFDTFLEENVQLEWEMQRRRIYEHLGLAKPSEDRADGTNDLRHSVFGDSGTFGKPSLRGRGLGMSGLSKSVSFAGSKALKSVIGTPPTHGALRASLFADVSDKGNPQEGPDNRTVREKQERYAERVRQLNESRVKDLAYPLIQRFAQVETQSSSDSTAPLGDAYKALIEITGERSDVLRPSDVGAVRERQYSDAYARAADSGTALKERIVSGSRTFLEKQFYQQLENTIAKNPREASLGGVPSTINKVRAYIRLKAMRKDLAPENLELQRLNQDYCWVLIFYLLRSGLIKEAAQYVHDNERAIKSLDRNFPSYISAYSSNDKRRLPRELQSRINAEYSQRTKLAPEDSLDPYRMACYKVIGRCELTRKTIENISQGMEDWVWLQFALAREVNRAEEAAGEVFGLDELRVQTHDIVQRHFAQDLENNGGYAAAFLLQILAGMFERAVAWLYAYNYVSAVHFAIALDFYGLLRVSDAAMSDSDLLTFNTQQKPQISFGRMLGYYTRDFRIARPVTAVDYLTLICLDSDLPGPAGQLQVSLCHEALRELVLETREFAQLLGDIRSDGQRIEGAIEQRLKLLKLVDQQDFLTTVTIQAASVAEDAGRITDAVLLYHLAEKYDNVILIINRALSEAVVMELGQEPMRLQPLKPRTEAGMQSTGQRQHNDQQQQQQQQQQRQQPQAGGSLSLTSVDDPVTLARNMISLYNSNALYYRKIRQMNRDACGVLLRLCEAKARVEQGKWAEALDILTSLQILPLTAHNDIPTIRASAQSLSSLPQVLQRTIPSLLIWTITCCSKQRDVLANTAFENDSGTRRQMAEDLKTKTKDLMIWAGLVRYKLPPRVMEVIASATGSEAGW